MAPYRVAIFTTHPVQYRAPLFRAFASRPAVEPTVFYASRHGLDEAEEPEFDQSFSWDIPLLDGYEHVFLNNLACNPDVNRFFGLNVPEIFERWKAKSYDAFLVIGWRTRAHWQAIRAAVRAEVPLLLRGESNLKMKPQSTAKAWLRSIFWLPARKVLYRQLFDRAEAILTIGTRNREYFRHFGVPERKLFRAPYCVENSHFRVGTRKAEELRRALRARLDIENDAVLFLSVAKFIPKKRPLDLLQAFSQLVSETDHDVHLLFVGDGPMRDELERHIHAEKLDHSVTLAGFVNQSQLPAYYAAADALVLPSGPMETWGLVVNEAMSAGLPVIVSDAVGCAPDLVEQERNGFVFPYRDTEALASRMNQLTHLSREERKAWGEHSREIIDDFSSEAVAESLGRALESTVAATHRV
jgi:glycosyltransferase involved in cell wall biosynthesis